MNGTDLDEDMGHKISLISAVDKLNEQMSELTGHMEIENMEKIKNTCDSSSR